MGNPLYGDDLGRMCYNPAKNWQIGWYPANQVLFDPVATPSWTGTLIGVAEWKNNVNNLPVVIKIESGTATDAFVGFNRATGMNDQNDEAGMWTTESLVTMLLTCILTFGVASCLL